MSAQMHGCMCTCSGAWASPNTLIYPLFVCSNAFMCTNMSYSAHVELRGSSLLELILSFYHVSFWDQIQLIRLSKEYFSLLSHLTGTRAGLIGPSDISKSLSGRAETIT